MGPLYISGMDKVRNFKFGVRIDLQAYKPKKCKSRSKGAWATSRDLLLEFWDPLYISGTDKARNFKFGVPIGTTNQKTAKVGQKGHGLRHVTYFLNFGTPSIFLE